MRQGLFTLRGKLKYLSGTFLILSIFLLDCLLGSVSLLMGEAKDMNEWVYQIQMFCAARSVFAWIPYLLIFILLKHKIYIDRLDEALLTLCLLMSVIETSDYLTNGNWRAVWMDWIVFGIFALTLIYFKIRSVIKRIH